MKAIYKRNGREMDITQNPDGTWKTVDQDGVIFKISDSTKKRWFKIIEEAAPAPAKVSALPEATTAPEAAAVIQEENASEETPLVTTAFAAQTESVVFLSDAVVSKPGAKTTQWEMRFGLLRNGVPVTLVIKDAACLDYPRGPVQAYIIDPEGPQAQTYSAKATLEQYFEGAGKEISETVKKLRREYFKANKKA